MFQCGNFFFLYDLNLRARLVNCLQKGNNLRRNAVSCPITRKKLQARDGYPINWSQYPFKPINTKPGLSLYCHKINYLENGSSFRGPIWLAICPISIDRLYPLSRQSFKTMLFREERKRKERKKTRTWRTLFSFSQAAILSAVRKSSSSTAEPEPTLAFDAAADVTATVEVVDVMPGPRCWG